MTTTQIISDHQAFLDFFQVMGERGATSEILMEAGISANEAVIGTPDEGTNMDYWNIPPLVVNATTEAAIIASRGGIDNIREFMANNAEWEQYQTEESED